ncbi:MAG: OpgC domain-containing protein [Acetobacteraceae bacterium]|nr:OpgC domain-containing protein [Acetobacteraceae bacterium]
MKLIVSNRDLRVDFFRGLALWWIFVDHIPANWVAQFSLRNFALCDATEVFVLLAGYAAGLAYGRTLDRYGWLYSGADVLRRAWVLYVAHIFLFVVFSAQVSYSATALDRSDYLEEIHVDVLADAPYRAMLEALLLNYQPAYLNILPMYVALLGLFALALPLLRAPAVLLAVSGAAYVAVRITGYNLPSWTGEGWYFNPIAWQFLFMIGAVLSYGGIRPPGPRWLYDQLAALIVVFGVLLVWLVWPYPDIETRMPAAAARILLSVDKESLHPMRLLSILALTWLVARTVPASAAWLRSWAAKPVIICGQHSLAVFCSGIFLSFLGRLAMEEQPNWAVQAAVNVVGALALVGVGSLSAWYRQRGAMARAALPATSPAGNAGVV